MEVAASGLTLVDPQWTNELLLNAGTVIAGMNCTRNHLSQLKGGRLVDHAQPARVVTLTMGTARRGVRVAGPLHVPGRDHRAGAARPISRGKEE